MNQFTERSFHSAGLTLNYVTATPGGPSLIFLHGVCRRWQDCLTVVPALASRWRIVALEQRGHGASSRASNYLVADYVDDAVRFVEQLHSKPVVLFGHSLGAMVAAGVAARAPHLVRAVVLEDPPFSTMGERIGQTPLLAQFSAWRDLARRHQTQPPGDRQKRMARLSAELGDVLVAGRPLSDTRDAATLRFTAHCLLDMDPETLTPVVEGRWLDGYNLAEIAAAIRCPALLLQGNADQGAMLTDADAANFAQRASLAQWVRVPEAGHSIHWMAPATAARLAISFLETV
jgi:pimeloyl-ACP methyl ester carboxylesterase